MVAGEGVVIVALARVGVVHRTERQRRHTVATSEVSAWVSMTMVVVNCKEIHPQ